MTFFANNAAASNWPRRSVEAVPCAEQVRFVSSGGEADMYAMRLARAYTGRDKILKFEGGYHGMSAEAQMSLAPGRRSTSRKPCPTAPASRRVCADEMLIAPFNDLDFLARCWPSMARYRRDHRRAAAADHPARARLSAGLRDLCDRHGVVLIFDEIVTGFRLAYGGAQERYGVTPIICTLGKIIGGGFPLAAIAGRAEIMAHFDKAAVGPQTSG
jgi:glutamate-1-semialdehyde 2,1-aminomutase